MFYYISENSLTKYIFYFSFMKNKKHLIKKRYQTHPKHRCFWPKEGSFSTHSTQVPFIYTHKHRADKSFSKAKANKNTRIIIVQIKFKSCKSMHKIITCLNQGHLEPLKVTHTAKMAIEEKRRENKIEG